MDVCPTFPLRFPSLFPDLHHRRIVGEGKKVSDPSASYKFCIAKAYFLLHVITTSKLADAVQEKQARELYPDD